MRSELVGTVIAAALFAAGADASPSGEDPVSATVSPRTARAAFSKLPPAFEVNRGQAPEGWDFLVRCDGYHAFVASTGIVFSFRGAGLSMSIEDASPVEPETRGLELPGKANYFLGDDPRKWISDVPLVRGARYGDVARGTSWSVSGAGRALEFAFDLTPGADAPRLWFRGARRVRLADDGSLRAEMPGGVATISAPVAWQTADGARLDAHAKFVIDADGAVRVTTTPRDANRVVHVDPTVTFETYLGGGADDLPGGAAMDAAGAAYLSGTTRSTDFPATTGAFDTSSNGAQDGFVAKLSASGTSLVYATYIGGNLDESFNGGISVDANGYAYVAGNSASSNYPTTPGVYGSAGSAAGVLTKLNATGSSLLWSTYLAFNGIQGSAVTPSGTVYTLTQDVLELYAADAATRVFSRRIRPTSVMGSQSMSINAVATDAAGDAYVACDGNMTNFSATPGAYQTSYAGGADAIVTKIDATGAVVWTTFLGGSGGEKAIGIGVNLAGQAYVTGTTTSPNFPVTAGAYRTTYTGADSYVARLSASGSSIRWATYLGVYETRAICVHPLSSFVLAGYTAAPIQTADPFQASPGGPGDDGFAMKFNRDGSLAWSSYLGGSDEDILNRIGMGPDGSAVFLGSTFSTDLPTLNAVQSVRHSGYDACVVKVPDTLPTSVDPVAVDTATLPTWTVGYAYTPFPLGASGGISPYKWSVVSGTLPPGAAVSAAGVVSGTLTQTGSYTFKVRTEDACELFAERNLTLVVNPPPSIASPMPGATVNTPYDVVVPVTSGSGAMTFAIVTGAAPPGTSLAADGHLAGTPSSIGDFSFTAKVTDGRGATGTGLVALHVNNPPVIAAATMPQATATRPYTFQFQGGSGTAPLTWSIASGSLPAPSLSASLGKLTGAAAAAGTYDFTVRVTDAAGATTDRAFQTVVNPLPQVTSTMLPPAAVGRPYAAALGRSGGTAPFSWFIDSGMLPSGLTLASAAGTVGGQVTGTAPAVVTFVVNDATGASAPGTVTIPVAGAVDVSRKKASVKVALAADGPSPPVLRYFEVTAGAVVGIKVTGGTDTSSGVVVRLADAADAELDLSPYTRETAKTLTVKGAVLPSSGRWFLTVTPAPGARKTMTIAVTIAPPVSFASGALVGPSTDSVFAFAAQDGARVSITAKAAKGSAALPTIVSVVGPDGTDLVPGGSLKLKGATATFTSKTALAGGDWRVTFAARDATSGAIAWSVKLKSPKLYGYDLSDVPAGD